METILKGTHRLASQKRKEGKESAACLYRAASNHLRQYLQGRDLPLHRLEAGHIEGFTTYLSHKLGLSANTVCCYLAALRAMYNRLREQSLRHGRDRNAFRGEHPFKGLKQRHEPTSKRAIRPGGINKLSSLPPDTDKDARRAADFFLFSYLGCGIPFADLARLRGENLRDGVLRYRRQKTGIPVAVRLTAGMRAILARYASPFSEYLFPILAEGCTYNAYKRCLRRYNETLRELGRKLGIARLTSYVARHSWATEAYRRHTPMAVISQALGHTSERTTRFYLDQLDISDLAKANRLIVGDLDRMVGRP